MLTLQGKIINVFRQPEGEKDGKKYGGQHKVQIIGDISLPNGQTRCDMLTLTAHNINDFEDLQSKDVSIPVGVMSASGSLIYFIPKGSKPSILS